jgi:hypothetical protein
MILGLFLIQISADEWGPPVSRSVATRRALIGWPRRHRSTIIAGIKRPISDRPGPKLGPALSARHLLPRW